MITKEFTNVVTQKDVRFQLLLMKPMPVDQDYRFDGDYDHERTLTLKESNDLMYHVYSRSDIDKAQRDLYTDIWKHRMSVTESDSPVKHRIDNEEGTLHVEIGENKFRDNTAYMIVASSESKGSYAIVSLSEPGYSMFNSHTMKSEKAMYLNF
jgi:hypothetical protein